MILTLVSYAFDVALWFLFMRRYARGTAPRRGLFLLLIPALAAYSLGRLHLIAFPQATAQLLDLAMMPASILLCFLLAHVWHGLRPKAALLLSMIFCIAIHVGRRTHYYVFLPWTQLVIGSWGQPLVMGALKTLFVLLLLPGMEFPVEEDIASRRLIPFVFAVFVCQAMDVGSLGTGSAAGVTLACYLSAFLLTWLEKRVIIQDGQIARLRAIESDMRLQSALASQQRRDEDLIRRMYHDLKHQIAALEAGAHSADALRELRESLERVKPVSYSDHPVLNAIFNDRIRTAKEAGIALQVESRFGTFPMLTDLEVSTLFSNALANAIEAAGLSEGRWIRCRYNETAALAVVVIRNASPEVRRDAAGRILSRKGGALHGIGLTSMEAIAQRHGGSMRTDVDGGVFTLTVALPKPARA